MKWSPRRLKWPGEESPTPQSGPAISRLLLKDKGQMDYWVRVSQPKRPAIITHVEDWVPANSMTEKSCVKFSLQDIFNIHKYTHTRNLKVLCMKYIYNGKSKSKSLFTPLLDYTLILTEYHTLRHTNIKTHISTAKSLVVKSAQTMSSEIVARFFPYKEFFKGN